MNIGVQWLPLAEFALRSGMSISTLRRKIKSNSIDYRMEEGRYMIRFEGSSDQSSAPPLSSARIPVMPYVSDDRAARSDRVQTSAEAALRAVPPTRLERPIADQAFSSQEVQLLRKMMGENALYLRAMEARVSGLAKKLENFSEQVAELKMLVKIFEEKMDSRG